MMRSKRSRTVYEERLTEDTVDRFDEVKSDWLAVEVDYQSGTCGRPRGYFLRVEWYTRVRRLSGVEMRSFAVAFSSRSKLLENARAFSAKRLDTLALMWSGSGLHKTTDFAEMKAEVLKMRDESRARTGAA